MSEIITIPEAQRLSRLSFIKPLFKAAKEKLALAKQYTGEDKENVERNYQLVVGCMKEAIKPPLPPTNFKELTEAINRDPSRHTPELEEVIILGERRYRVHSFLPPDTILPIEEMKEKKLTLLPGVNPWDLPPDPSRIFLPFNYVLQKLF